MRKKKLKNTLTEVKMVERYRHINKFRYSIFKITNPATPSELKLNPIMAKMVLDKLRELQEEIREDINGITVESIKAEDIFGGREAEVSELLAMEICLYDFQCYEDKYTKYLKGEALQRIFPTHKRDAMVEKYTKDIKALEETIADLELIDKQLAKEDRKNLEDLKMKKKEFEDKFDFPTLEEIEISLFIKITSYLNNILEDIKNRIAYLERGLA